MKGQPLVFVSHASADDAIAKLIIDFLQRLNLYCWAYFKDNKSIEFRAEIEVAIGKCDVFLLIASTSSLASPEVLSEINEAHVQKKKICTYRLDMTGFPRGFSYILRSHKWVEARGDGNNTIEDLAHLVLSGAGIKARERHLLIQSAQESIREADRKIKSRRQQSLLKWNERFWSYKKNSRSGRLTQYDKAKLSSYGKRLGVSDEEQRQLEGLYSRDLRRFRAILKQALAQRLDEETLRVIETERIKCCIDQSEAKLLAARICGELSIETNSADSANGNDNWLVVCIREYVDKVKQRKNHGPIQEENGLVDLPPNQVAESLCIDSLSASCDPESPESGSSTSSSDKNQPESLYELNSRSSISSSQSKDRGDAKPRLRKFFNCNDQFLIVSEVFLGNEVKRLNVTHIERADGSFIFAGTIVTTSSKSAPEKSDTQSKRQSRIEATREFKLITITGFTIRFIQEGFGNYLDLSVDPSKDSYARFRGFVEAVGIPVSVVESQQHLSERKQKSDVDGKRQSEYVVHSQAKSDVATGEMEKEHSALDDAAIPISSKNNFSGSIIFDSDDLEDEYNAWIAEFASMYASMSSAELLNQLFQLAIACRPDLNIVIEPGLTTKSQTLKALKKHHIRGEYLGSILIHWNTSFMRAKNGIILFEKGMLVSSLFERTRLLYFGNLDYSTEVLNLGLVYDDVGLLKINGEGYCGIEGQFVDASQSIHITLPETAVNLLPLIGSVLEKVETRAQLVHVARDAITDRFNDAFKDDPESLVYFPGDIYQDNNLPKASFVDHFKIFRDSYGVMPVPTEVIALVDCGLTQSLLITAFGLHFIGREVLDARANRDFFAISWKSFQSMSVEPPMPLTKVVGFRILSHDYTGIVRFDFKGRESSFPGFAENAQALCILISMTANVFARIQKPMRLDSLESPL